MHDMNTSFIKLMNKKFAYMIILVLLLLTFSMLAVFFINQEAKDEYTLLNTFENQELIIEKLSKEADRKYLIIQALQNADENDKGIYLREEIESINKSLKESKENFSLFFQTLKNGYVKKEDGLIDFTNSLGQLKTNLGNGEILWNDFEKAIDVVIANEEINQEVVEALKYINVADEELINLSGEINKTLIDMQKKVYNTKLLISLSLFAAVLIVLLMLVLKSYKCIVIPLSELFNRFNNINPLKYNIDMSLPEKNELMPVVTQIDAAFSKLNKLIRLINNINQDTSFEGNLRYIYDNFSEFIPYQHIGIALLKDDEETVEASYGISDGPTKDLPKKLLGIKARLDETSLGDVVRKGEPRVINDLESYTKHREAIYNKILIDEGIKASITLPLKLNNKTVGIIFFSSIEKDIYKKKHIDFLATLSSSIAISLNKNIFIDQLLYSTVLALAKLAESRDEDTGEHLERMKKYSVKITEMLLEDNIYADEISISFIKEIERFSPMHDIGKVGIRDEILLKPGKLTDDEFEEMKKHTIFGAEVLRAAEKQMMRNEAGLFEMGIEIAEGHHEKWDGTGYPYKKSGHDIPLSARIVAAADVLDALTSERPYKKAFSFEESFDIIVKGKGKHFDPNIVDTMIRHKDEIYEIYNRFNNCNKNLQQKRKSG